MSNNSNVTKQLPLTITIDFLEKLQKEADKQHRTMNGYIVWLLANRPKKENPE